MKDEFQTSRVSCIARRVEPTYEHLTQEGDFYIKPMEAGLFTLVVWLPGLSRWVGTTCIQISQGPKRDGSWQWNGDLDKPDINPSILVSTTVGEARTPLELWHGYMRNGKLESV